jgi:NAD-dependent deacetylase
MMLITAKLIELLRANVRTVALTGAGVSAESGVPTFRGSDGLWSKFDPTELASMNAFMRNPKLVWEWYLYRRDVIGKAEPNKGHEILAKMEQHLSAFTLITQNVDNLHRRAGSQNVIELHGNIQRNKCRQCGEPMNQVEIDPDNIPRCSCGGQIRPDVVWFGELLPEEALTTAAKMAEESALFLSIGTSALVYPAADLPVLAKNNGAYLVEINPEPTGLTPYADEVFRGKSGEILPIIWQAAITQESSVEAFLRTNEA